MHVTVPHQRRFNNNQHVITGGCICNNTWPSIAMLRTLGTIPQSASALQSCSVMVMAYIIGYTLLFTVLVVPESV